ncbi:hypothetical protein BKA82DRAFT_1001293 [Pisolithus tinctorius]|uniref:Uncharacterized protein n=1 Tax=Pisolithus tinctorius Marx 270 TaxID=870435 RepID=A0A0C3NRB2_PISTI|nr:hypothetical protein BKA82DRAFT_1001293 [Pisolithus tinctorius]KIO03385.1 hypothetical protein M404DRAFT_1001293 [Pisolithus tinctorius Marx 270]
MRMWSSTSLSIDCCIRNQKLNDETVCLTSSPKSAIWGTTCTRVVRLHLKGAYAISECSEDPETKFFFVSNGWNSLRASNCSRWKFGRRIPGSANRTNPPGVHLIDTHTVGFRPFVMPERWCGHETAKFPTGNGAITVPMIRLMDPSGRTGAEQDAPKRRNDRPLISTSKTLPDALGSMRRLGDVCTRTIVFDIIRIGNFRVQPGIRIT